MAMREGPRLHVSARAAGRVDRPSCRRGRERTHELANAFAGQQQRARHGGKQPSIHRRAVAVAAVSQSVRRTPANAAGSPRASRGTRRRSNARLTASSAATNERDASAGLALQAAWRSAKANRGAAPLERGIRMPAARARRSGPAPPRAFTAWCDWRPACSSTCIATSPPLSSSRRRGRQSPARRMAAPRLLVNFARPARRRVFFAGVAQRAGLPCQHAVLARQGVQAVHTSLGPAAARSGTRHQARRGPARPRYRHRPSHTRRPAPSVPAGVRRAHVACAAWHSVISCAPCRFCRPARRRRTNAGRPQSPAPPHAPHQRGRIQRPGMASTHGRHRSGQEGQHRQRTRD